MRAITNIIILSSVVCLCCPKKTHWQSLKTDSSAAIVRHDVGCNYPRCNTKLPSCTNLLVSKLQAMTSASAHYSLRQNVEQAHCWNTIFSHSRNSPYLAAHSHRGGGKGFCLLDTSSSPHSDAALPGAAIWAAISVERPPWRWSVSLCDNEKSWTKNWKSRNNGWLQHTYQTCSQRCFELWHII